jgi:hypothetical protein
MEVEQRQRQKRSRRQRRKCNASARKRRCQCHVLFVTRRVCLLGGKEWEEGVRMVIETLSLRFFDVYLVSFRF